MGKSMLQHLSPWNLRIVRGRTCCQVELGGFNVEGLPARLPARPRRKRVLYHLDLLDALSISDDPGLTETIHLVLKELGALDVVGEVVRVVGGSNDNPFCLILQGIAVILQATPGEGALLLLLLELL
jgi:hypothetical protein